MSKIWFNDEIFALDDSDDDLWPYKPIAVSPYDEDSIEFYMYVDELGEYNSWILSRKEIEFIAAYVSKNLRVEN